MITIAEGCSIPPNAVPSVLNFYHELGVLLYYSKIHSLRDVVIATSQWLINHIAKLLIPSGLEDQGRECYYLLRKNGMLMETLYQEVLKHMYTGSPSPGGLAGTFSIGSFNRNKGYSSL